MDSSPTQNEPTGQENLDSQAETWSSTTSLSVQLGAIENDMCDSMQKRLETPAQHQHANAALHLSSDLKTFINTCIAFLGSGVLGLPYAFRKCGILLGLVTLVGVAALSTYAMMLVVQCKYKLKQQGNMVSKYGDIGYFAIGHIGAIIVNTALVISQTGFCTAYLIFIAFNANKFLNVSKYLIIVVCVPPLVIFSLLRHMRELAYVALLADFMCILGLLVVLTIDLSYMNLNQDYVEPIGVLSAVPFFFGVASYCFEGVGMVLPLENSMRYKENFQPILVCTIVIITSLYATFGVCGYLAFGDETDAVITLNVEGSGGLVTLVKMFLCLGLFFTYPVMLFPVFEVLQPLLLGGNKFEDAQSMHKKSIILRAGIVLITAVIAAAIPDFGRFISFIGSTCCSLLAFILPAFFHLRLFRDEPRTYWTWLHRFFLCAVMLLGFIMLGVGVAEFIDSVY
ncbi:amino acid auxin permease family [Plasmopara halstedii]|uniref:Amino acid auxin permease family n=1 Tax=Plasmopara halstedii TaxID=4781 RepID=A0A0N7L7V1_PLAHL|nr:amino acid auxin permease family [Plasmopara halstedii]CEG48099.1 amino acid auxin permease family [Plasmopara halstedii]|eukprot:XP_024584468.1 amino acid auxin permease family [Plasmopara halstedii]